MTERRAELAEAATDYVLEHGLIGLSLRPMAAALGTSDRMLLYHFADKSDLSRPSCGSPTTARSPASGRCRRPPTYAGRCSTSGRRSAHPSQARCQRLYVEAAALGVLGAEPFASVVAEANEVWLGGPGRRTSWPPASRRTARHVPRASSRPRSWASSSTSRWRRPPS